MTLEEVKRRVVVAEAKAEVCGEIAGHFEKFVRGDDVVSQCMLEVSRTIRTMGQIWKKEAEETGAILPVAAPLPGEDNG